MPSSLLAYNILLYFIFFIYLDKAWNWNIATNTFCLIIIIIIYNEVTIKIE